MSNKNDRRSQRTRQLLGTALVELILEKGYRGITVEDLIERANVGRSTFYTHYHNKDDLLIGELDRVIDAMSGQIPQDIPARRSFLPSLELFRHVAQHHELYKALVWGPGADLLFKHEQKYLSEKAEQHLLGSGQRFTVPVPVLANFVAGSFLALLKWWLENKMVYSAEQMDEMLQRLIQPGVENCLE